MSARGFPGVQNGCARVHLRTRRTRPVQQIGVELAAPHENSGPVVVLNFPTEILKA